MKRLDLTSVTGFPLSIGLILLGQAIEGGKLHSLVQLAAALIVFGGTFGAVLVSFSIREVWRAIMGLQDVLYEQVHDPEETIDTIVRYATQARKQGIMSLEDSLETETDPFMRRGLGLAVDGSNPHVVREMLEMEIEAREKDEELPARVWESAGGYAPTVGIIGAVLGLIHVMDNLSDPSKLGAGIAVAFVATVYGVGSANLIFLPVGTKLRVRAQLNAWRRELLVEGILAIQEGLNLRLIEEKLRGFSALPMQDRKKATRRAA